MIPTRRRRLFVDFKLQGRLLAHTAMYWFYCLLSVMLIACCWITFVRHPATSRELFRGLWVNFGPALLGSILLLPLVLMDCLRLSNRFAGPMVRIQRALKKLANGESADPVYLRKGDYWAECADDLNRLIALRSAAAPSAPKTRAEPVPAGTVSPADLLCADLVPDAGVAIASNNSV